MTYQVKHTETTNPSKPAYIVEDQRLNTETDVTFPGKNYAGYAPYIAENFLHLLENFAKPTPPSKPIEGQLWYDNSAGVNLLKVYDGAGNWNPAGSLKKASEAPSVASSTSGDLWVNTNTQQLYLFSGSTWLLVGPQFSAGLKTGADIETIIDTENVSHNVITMYSENNRIAIFSKAAFTPKASLAGFISINQGVNLSSVDATSTTTPTKFWGVASKADALVVSGATVASTNFLRSDQASVTNYPISVRDNGGIRIGSDLSFTIGLESNSTVLESKTDGSSISLKLNNGGTKTTVMYVDAGVKVGIGPEHTNPSETLDVLGNIKTNARIIVTGDADPDPGVYGREASISTNGGLNINKSSTFGDDITTFGQVLLNYLDENGDPRNESVILPASDSANLCYDIGSSTRKFKNVWAESFNGNFSGTFTGNSFGNPGGDAVFNGSATSLASPTAFSLTGDVTSNTINFNGQTIDGTATFTTSITQDLITAKTLVTDSQPTDLLLVYRSGSNSGLKKTTKQAFISNIPTVPVGAIFPFAGNTVPTGYLLCDGSEVLISQYSELYSTIGYTYRTPAYLIGRSTFALPDLRGRFPLGRDNMDNGLSVPSADDGTVLIDAGGGSANRVTDVTADSTGSSSGSESRSLVTQNLPDHTHNLNSGLAQYYAAGLPSAGSDPNAVPNLGMPTTSTGSGLPNSGGVESARLGVAFNTMNPYQTINYIIFTGVL